MSRTRTISALHNVPLTNLVAEQRDFIHCIIHLQQSRYSRYPQILLTSYMFKGVYVGRQSKVPSNETLAEFLSTFGQEDPAAFAKRLIAGVKKIGDAREARLYFLNLTSGCYHQYPDHQNTSPLDPMGVSNSSNTPSELRYAVKYGHPIVNGRSLFLPVMRDLTCVAILELQYESKSHQGLSEFDWLSAYAGAFHFAYIFRFVQILLDSLKEPIKFEDIHEIEYYDSLLSALTLASGIDRIALRERKYNGDLICLAASGFLNSSPRELSFLEAETPSVFLKAMDSQLPQYISNAQDIAEIRRNPIYGGVRSFLVLPIRVGEGIFGTLSFAIPITYKFSHIEITGLEAISNGAGVAITNFHSNKEKENEFNSLGDLALSMSAVDVSQAVRHESIAYIDRAQTNIAKLLRKPKLTVTEHRPVIQSLSDTLELLRLSVDKIKLATKPPDKEIKTKGIEDIWKVTCDLLKGGRLDPGGIKPCFSGKNVQIEMYPDWLRTAFFNLLLNSYDAYKQRSGGGEKSVLLRVISLSDDRLVLEYTDRAGGIDINRLTLPTKHKKTQRNQLVWNDVLFHPGVTSKGRNGSGYGLYLARKGIQAHQPFGSLDLAPSKGGVRFRITLPTRMSS